jgi:hypothetical protein
VATPTLTRVLKPGMYGKDVQGVRRACRKFTFQDPPTAPLSIQRKFNPSMTVLVKAAQDQAVLPKSGWVGPQLMEALRDADAFDAYAVQLLEQYADEHAVQVPPLGPIAYGCRSLLVQDLTHNTDGLAGYPALDDGWVAGRAVVAPEPLAVTQHGDSQGGVAFYATGLSKLQYWIGHVATQPAVGAHFRKGETMTRIANMGSKSHVHIGIDARPLIGKPLLYGATGHGPDYSHGSPTIGAQLAAAL